jgi:hypothetical protein
MKWFINNFRASYDPYHEILDRLEILNKVIDRVIALEQKTEKLDKELKLLNANTNLELRRLHAGVENCDMALKFNLKELAENITTLRNFNAALSSRANDLSSKF